MIAIYINNQLADYFGDLTIKKDNPLFSNFDKEPTEHTYTLTLPVTATNAKIFSLIQHTLATPKTLSARIEIDGVQVLDGSCNVQSWSESGYSVYFSGIAPYEDVNISPIKKMLGDTRLLGEVIEIADQRELTGSLGDVGAYLNYTYLGKTLPAVVSADTYGWRARTSNEVGAIFNRSNVTFAIGYILQRIAGVYGIRIDEVALFADLMVMQYGTKHTYDEVFEGGVIEKVALRGSLPKLTPKQFIENVAILMGGKMKVDYYNNRISFTLLNTTATPTTQLSADINTINYQDALAINSVKFADIKPFEYKYKNEDDDEVEIIKQYSIENSISFGEGDKQSKSYTLPFSLPNINANIVVTPLVYEEDDERLANIILCRYADYSLTSADIDLSDDFGLWKKVTNRHTSIKFSARITPIQLATLDLWKPVFVDNIGNIYIKSISYKSGGESDVEGYLY
jgi:hypothetical protein